MDHFDEMVESFQRSFGMSEAAAKIAVIGRGMTEREARASWNAAGEMVEAERVARESARIAPSAVSSGERELAGAAVDVLGMDAPLAARYAHSVQVREAKLVGGQRAQEFCRDVARELRRPGR